MRLALATALALAAQHPPGDGLSAFLDALDAPSVEEVVASLGPAPDLGAALHPPASSDEERACRELWFRLLTALQVGAVEPARALAEEHLRAREALDGPEHWLSADARDLLAEAEALAALPPEDRARLTEARGAAELVALARSGRYAAALERGLADLETRTALRPSSARDRADACGALGWILLESGDAAGSERLARATWELRRRALGAQHPDTASSLVLLGSALLHRARFREAREVLLHGLAGTARFGGPWAASAHNARLALAAAAEALGDLDLSVGLLRDAVERPGPAASPFERAAANNNLAVVLHDLGYLDEAARRYRDALEVLRAAVGEGHPFHAQTRLSLAPLLVELGAFEEAEEATLAALEVFRSGDSASRAWLARGQANLGWIRHRQGRLAEAEALLRGALAELREIHGEEHPQTAEALSNLAAVLNARGDRAAAEPLAREAVRALARAHGDDHPRVADAASMLGQVLLARGDLAGAEERFRRALEIRGGRFGDDHHLVAVSRTDLARVLARQGELDEARVLLEAALASFAPDRRDRVEALHLLGSVHLAHGELDAAEEFLRDALEERARLLGADHPARAVDLEWLARLHVARGEPERAIEAWTEALELAENARTDVLGEERERALYGASHAHLAGALAVALFDAGRYEESFAATERGRGRVLLDTLARSEGAVSGAAAERRALLAHRLEESRLEALERRADLGEDGADELREQRERLALARDADLAAHDQGRAALRALWPDARPADLATLRAALEPGERVLSYLWTEERVALVVVPPPGSVEAGAVTGIALAGTRDEVAALGRLVERARDELSAPSSSRPALSALGQRVLPAAAGWYAPGTRRLVVLPAGPLRELPLEALTWPEGAGPATSWIDLDVEAAYAPSGSVFVGRRSLAREGTDEVTALVLSDPEFGPGSERLVARLRDAGGLPRLPGTRAEAEAIDAAVRAAGGRVLHLRGTEATLARLEEELAGHALVHLATHGFAGSQEDPADASLALAAAPAGGPELLTLGHMLRDWSGVLEGSRLVVLSACDTRRGTEVGASSMSLTWGFLYAGAPAVVASLWPVDDTATALLMGRFYEHLLGTDGSEPMEPARALLAAKRWLRDADRRAVRTALRARGAQAGAEALDAADLVPYADPCFWAGFVLLGDPR